MTIQLESVPAPVFATSDMHGRTVRLGDFKGQKNVVLVFNRTLY